ncbi:MotA/TolQ/ExbB proton channel family protein [Gilvimarinus sp. SDUM040013]|uniref:MotA/TolQ/ExbB proton channel family protein n=1 Tax=Gilvimarinus gilvus TaxID=3058038 RepID=A0ABU4RUG0_9GAMM|nr:MotA/TolQ/ExbB proton channel family protein [Gilvimarinus sp. SDUM040013]MDO3388610.1 MotA/TolQ/ExbB proton channel family protein [Gilvimarinus sp. SDUM040013]MDX6848518.1 MotA/TolQ/ExbB proton channel family protein [Gilvimarinus sp. SDUM040013]
MEAISEQILATPVLWLIISLAIGCYTILMYLCFFSKRNPAWLKLVDSWRTSLKAMAGALPLLGLLGTITGLMSTFSTLATGISDIQLLMASGISSALTTTQAGIALAVPGILLCTLLNRKRAKFYDSEMA